MSASTGSPNSDGSVDNKSSPLDTKASEVTASMSHDRILKMQLTACGVAVCGLAIACRSVRAFKKFTHPNDIPNSFFKNNITISGKVARIDFVPDPVLAVDHLPLIGSSLRRPGPYMSVKIEGVQLSGNAVSWIQALVVGNDVNIRLLYPNNDDVHGIVTYKNYNLAPHLIQLGFGTITELNPDLKDNDVYKKYCKQLIRANKTAEFNKSSIGKALIKYQPKVTNTIKSIVSSIVKLPLAPFKRQMVRV